MVNVRYNCDISNVVTHKFRQIDSLIEGMNQLSKSIIEISDSVPPIAQMTAINVLFGENLKKLLEENKILK
tara:strand:+ start:114 stop:326 length:213 start_codon:yes stop_codon:yes gene_type:complete